jgi:PDZ domain
MTSMIESTVKQSTHYLITVFVLLLVSQAQNIPLSLPTDHGMYVDESGNYIKIIGQIAEFKRSGSLLVSDMTVGIKTRKENIQLLGATAQTAVASAQPIFYFIPAKQEQEAGVNAGDLILIRLEEKSKRRQFEIAASGAWRKSSGITLTHQIQLLRDEITSGVYKVMPATELERGEYALFLARGEGMAPYVYDFSIQPTHAASGRQDKNWNTSPAMSAVDNAKTIARLPAPQATDQASIGVFAEGNANMRHDGIILTAVAGGGPADQVGIKAGDVILAVNDHYIFTITELRDAISHLTPGQKIRVRYRHNTTITDVSLQAMAIQ